MFKIFTGFFCLFICALSFKAAYADQCKSIVYSTHPYYPPFHWSKNTELQGASKVVIEHLLKQTTDATYQYKYISAWKRVLKALEKGEIDMVIGAKNASERANYSYFSKEIIFDNPIAIFYNSEREINLKTRTLETLSDKIGLRSIGDRFGPKIDSIIDQNINVMEVPDQNHGFHMLLNNRGDYFINGYYTGYLGLRALQLQSKINSNLIESNETGLYILYSKKSPCAHLRFEIDDALMNIDKTLDRTKVLAEEATYWEKTGKYDYIKEIKNPILIEHLKQTQ